MCVSQFFQFLIKTFFYIIIVLFDSNNLDFLIQVQIYSSSDNSDIGVPVASHSGHGVCVCE